MNLKKYSPLLLAALGLTACGGGEDPALESAIRKALKDGQVTTEEWQDLQAQSANGPYSDCAQLLALVEKVNANVRQKAEQLPSCEAVKKAEQKTALSFALFVENSNSMMGYFTGNTAFKDAMMDLGSRIEDKGKKNDYYFINDQPHKIGQDYEEFIQKMDRKTAIKVGNIRISKLDEMLGEAVRQVTEEGKTAILASDFIYDVNRQNPKDAFPKLKYSIKGKLQKLRERGDYGLLLLKMSSLYDGKYYDYQDRPTSIKEERPYYICILGKNAQLQEMYLHYDLKSIRGFEEAIIFYQPDGLSYYHSVLGQSYKAGQFSRPRGQELIQAIEKPSLDKRSGSFEMALAIDLSKLPAPASYALDKANYALAGGNFSIKEILPLATAEIHKNDQRYLGTASHIFILESSELPKDNFEIKLALKKQLPAWVAASHTEDDRNIKEQLDKTLGLQYWVSGISEAFNELGEDNYYFQIKLPVSN
ncbi:hypothetical protein [Saprospira grandis]|uniref:Lipoprotein n=1 Tax=Saprospira grandis (strain Lewin) TaxID=984262 RepID=H6L027_SAPGL|nr:hypothetical protein [Saprospira grandis]AFC26034.1 putative lipoprotein [Saprospira grandis str. Lewin]